MKLGVVSFRCDMNTQRKSEKKAEKNNETEYRIHGACERKGNLVKSYFKNGHFYLAADSRTISKKALEKKKYRMTLQFIGVGRSEIINWVFL